MKVYSNILALSLAGGATAFVPQASKSFTTKLASSFYSDNLGASQRGPLAASANPNSAADGSVFSQGGSSTTNTPSPFRVDAGGALNNPNMPAASEIAKDIWEASKPVTIQGGETLRTWAFNTDQIERVGLFFKTDGRPLNANIDLWQGPDNTPQKLTVYIEDGDLRPFSAVIETPGSQNAVAIYNMGPMEYPFVACVEPELEGGTGDSRFDDSIITLAENSEPRLVQGGAVNSYPFPPEVSSVQILLKTDGRPLNARVELLQGPNTQKQTFDIYCEDGGRRPFFCVIETPGTANTVRIINTATLEFPLTAHVEAYLMEPTANKGDPSGGYFTMS